MRILIGVIVVLALLYCVLWFLIKVGKVFSEVMSGM